MDDMNPNPMGEIIIVWRTRPSCDCACVQGPPPLSREVQAHHQPGGRAYAIASFFCSKRTMARIIDPMLADMREEYFEALAKGQKWKARWIHLSYYWGFVKLLPFYTAISMDKRLWKLFHSSR
jgi:hypothetical protein